MAAVSPATQQMKERSYGLWSDGPHARAGLAAALPGRRATSRVSATSDTVRRAGHDGLSQAIGPRPPTPGLRLDTAERATTRPAGFVDNAG